MIRSLFQLLVFCSLFGMISCNHDELTYDSSASLTFSADTITFDTIFTTIGSVTKSFKVYNRNSKAIKIESVRLEEGVSSGYRLNVDGKTGLVIEDIVLKANDSMYVFVEVTLDPVNNSNPLLISDGILFNSNNSNYKIVLEAFGQDVHLYNGQIIESETWINDKPYLILNSIAVDTGHVLTIEEGTRVYFHNNSSMLIWGQLRVEGTFENPVVFNGDRFDNGYDRSAGRWGTIYISPESSGNRIEYAHIKNANTGLWLGRSGVIDHTPQIELHNTMIQNALSASVLAYGAEISAYNCIFADSRDYGLALVMGGDYNFYHCVVSLVGAFVVEGGIFENYYREPEGYGVVITNWQPYYSYDESDNVVVNDAYKDLVGANFYNSIIYGSNRVELYAENSGLADFNYYFKHCIIKVPENYIDETNASYFNNCIVNQYPEFMNDSLFIEDYNFRLDTLSPAKDKGDMQVILNNSELQYDFEGKLRTIDGLPDIGAFERYE